MAGKSKLALYASAGFASIGGLCFGYDTGVISSVLTMSTFQEQMAGRTYLTSLEKGTITGLLLAGCFVGSLLSGPSAEYLSRKYTIILGSIVFIVGAAVQTANNGYAAMVAGRAVAGVGIGALSMVVPLYQSEIAPKEVRGRLIAIQQLAITIGIMLAFWVGYGSSLRDGKSAFQIPLAIQIVPAVFLGIGAAFLPYSPRWLLSKNRNEEALQVLAKLRAGGDTTDPEVVTEYEEIIAQINHEREVQINSYLELFKPGLLRRMVLGILVQIFQQFTGINSIMYYAPTIFQQAGVQSNSASLIASGVNGVLNVLATIPAVLYIDRLGRRKTMIAGAILMGASLLLLGIVMAATGRVYYDEAQASKAVDMSGNVHASYFCIVMIYFFVIGFAFSWGPVGWIYPAEIYPLGVRAKGTSITTAANWLMNFVISEICPVMLANITWGTYIFFGCCCAVMAIVVLIFFPETKGRSLEEMDVVFGGSVFVHRNKHLHADAEVGTHTIEKQEADLEEKN